MTQLLPSSRGERYQIQSLLGKGGMGVVYAALDVTRGQLVALKCLSYERFSTEQQRARATLLFEHEYYALSQLTHPHIVEAYDYGRDELGPYYTMECISGETLRARTPLPWRDACALVRDVVSALALIHSRSLVHRDLSPLNVHCASNGRVKLIDFGAMMPWGVAKQLVGTPAFTAPEAVQQQSLDGQVDLYSVGACLYFAITGELAYPAHSFQQLRHAWSSRPTPLSVFVADVPDALEQLVQSLLSLEPSDRPRTAGEVYERLTVIANLRRTEASGAAQAYVTRPKLVGREAQVSALQQAASAAAAGTGKALLVRAESGLGRSRLLDCAALEAKLAGLRVLRADAASSQAAALGVASQWLSALALEDPEVTPIDLQGVATLDSGARQRLFQDISQTLFAACKRAPIGLIVDDIHAIDEASRALLAILAAQAQEHALMLVSSSDARVVAPAGSAASHLADWSQPVQLEPLSEAESRALLVSMLGEVPNIDVLAVVSYRHCRGNPKSLMEATRGLIAQQLLQYAGGAWLISHDPAALAASLDQLGRLGSRIERLSADALELLQVVAIDEHQLMDLTNYHALLSHGLGARMHRALWELRDARWLELQEEHVRLAREGLRSELIASVSPERRRALYSQLADRAAGLGLPAVYEAHYRLRAEQPLAALAAMEVFSAFVEQHPTADVVRHPITLSVTDAISCLPDFPGAHPALRARYAMLSVHNAITVRGLPEYAAERLGAALQQIAPFSGMADWTALAELPADQRLTRALTLAAARCAAGGAGGMDVVGALRGQTLLCLGAAIAAYLMGEPALLDLIPDLTAFQALSPAIAAIARTIDALAKLAHGETWNAWDDFRALREELGTPAYEALDPLIRTSLRGLVLGFVSGLAADHASEGAAALIDEYERYMPDNAENQRTRVHWMRGDLSAAASSRRRFELLSVRLGSMSDARLFDLSAQLTLYALCDDSTGLRRTVQALQQVASTRRGWRARATVAEAQLLRCQGLVPEGLQLIDALMRELPRACQDYAYAAATHVELLHAAQRWAEAARFGDAYLKQLDRARAPAYRVQLALCRAYAALGEHAQAEVLFERARVQLETRKVTGVLSGVAHEIGARIALRRGDRAKARVLAARCEEQFRLGKHPALTARYHALERELAASAYTTMPPAAVSGRDTASSDERTTQTDSEGDAP